MGPPKATLNRARETRNTVRYEEPETDRPLVIGTLYVQVGRQAPRRPGDDHSHHRAGLRP